MPTSPNSNPSAKDETGLLEVLRLLLETKKARTIAGLLKYATKYQAPEAEERLRVTTQISPCSLRRSQFLRA